MKTSPLKAYAEVAEALWMGVFLRIGDEGFRGFGGAGVEGLIWMEILVCCVTICLQFWKGCSSRKQRS